MEIINSEINPRKLEFKGEGSEFFGVLFLNWILTLVTFGLYYPWARARTFSFLYSNTEMEGSRFAFHGTGKQMFLGFIKAIVLFLLIYGVFIWGSATNSFLLRIVGIIILYAGLALLIPIAIHGGLKYRLAKTSWRNIHFGYRGDKGELVKIFIPGIILSAITFGIYSSWFSIDIRKYLIKNIRFGNIKFSYHGKGGELFWINFKGVVLSILTLGIYLFWYMKNTIVYLIDNIEIEQNEVSYPIKSNIKTLDFIGLQLINFIMVIFTFGLATPWVKIRTINFFFERVEFSAEINLNQIEQTESDYSDATGDDFIDMMDIGII